MSDKVFCPFAYDSGFHQSNIEVTDQSCYRPDSEQVRALKFNPVGTGVTPLYDYPDGVVPDDDTVSDTIVAIRSGKLDKAEVDTLKQSLIDSAVNDSKLSHDKAVSDAIDKTLGISSSSDSEK